MRRLGVALLVAAAMAGTACSGSSSGASHVAASHPNAHAACALLRELQRDGAAVRQANVKDPTAFSAALDQSVKAYTATLQRLRPVVPRNLQSSVDQLHAAVEQFRFGDGVDAHANLNAYSARTCS